MLNSLIYLTLLSLGSCSRSRDHIALMYVFSILYFEPIRCKKNLWNLIVGSSYQCALLLDIIFSATFTRALLYAFSILYVEAYRL